MTKDSLTPIPTIMTENDDACVVESAFGEEFYLAVRKDGKYIVGWPPPETRGDRPKEQDKKLFAIAKDHIRRQRDFYNEKKLLGVTFGKDGKEVLTLVNLRRKVAPTHFGKIGGEWDRELGTVVEPWRLSIWRWKYDRRNQELILSSRGTFFRVILLPENPTPEVFISENLWEIKKQGDTVIVGQEPKIKP
jgi:hypothetical protein